uniref:Uncharacterized protein n=1 Tax=viral metagenome TaxID=1070528 RepID=A0A6M3LHX9_9ZZZZ
MNKVKDYGHDDGTQPDQVIRISVEDAQKLPGMLGKIVPSMIHWHGGYTCEWNGKKTFFTEA